MDRVVVVGGGVLGTMHAVLTRSRGASVRNFGLVWVSGRPPVPELVLAQRARTLWEDLMSGYQQRESGRTDR